MTNPPSPAQFRALIGGAGALKRGAATVVAWSLAGLFGGCATPSTPKAAQEGSTPKEYKVDHVTTANVENALAADAALRAFNFNVETVDGTVELNGYVDRPDQSVAAARDAAAVAGVTHVQNDIVVRQLARDQTPPPVSIMSDPASNEAPDSTNYAPAAAPPPHLPPANPSPAHSP